MAKVLMLMENHYEDAEAIVPFYRMLEAGHEVTVVGPRQGIYTSKHGYPFKADKAPDEVRVEDYQALLIPGGQAPDLMRIRPGLVKIVKEANSKGLVIGAICHAAQVLIEADIVRGKKATCYISVRTDLKNAGADYEDKSVVVDGKLVTSRHPGDLPDFCRELVKIIK